MGCVDGGGGVPVCVWEACGCMSVGVGHAGVYVWEACGVCRCVCVGGMWVYVGRCVRCAGVCGGMCVWVYVGRCVGGWHSDLLCTLLF